jgi:hypothetical protein
MPQTAAEATSHTSYGAASNLPSARCRPHDQPARRWHPVVRRDRDAMRSAKAAPFSVTQFSYQLVLASVRATRGTFLARGSRPLHAANPPPLVVVAARLGPDSAARGRRCLKSNPEPT